MERHIWRFLVLAFLGKEIWSLLRLPLSDTFHGPPLISCSETEGLQEDMKRSKQKKNDVDDDNSSAMCSGNGSLLLDTCFCKTGWKGRDCSIESPGPIPACGPYDDRCFFHDDYGVAQVNEARWKSAQSFEDATGATQRTSDRNDEHTDNFVGYSSLLFRDDGTRVPAGDTSTLGHMVEIGSGPFSTSLTIFEETGLRPKSITLVDPLAETYQNTMEACRYKHGILTNGKDMAIEQTTILPIHAELMSTARGARKSYDSIVLINMIENVQDAFLVYRSAFDLLKPGGLIVFHERYWPGYTGLETKNKTEFEMHPIRLNEAFVHWMATEFGLIYEKEHDRVGGNLGYYWIGRKRETGATLAKNLVKLSASMERHVELLQSHGFDESNVWGNIYNGRDIDQPREYHSYAALPWVKTICEVGFAGGHSTVIYLEANPSVKIYSFDDFGKRNLTTLAYETLKARGDITITEGDSTKTVPQFIGSHPDVYCDIISISIDGAHHAHFPDVDLRHFKYLANYPNIVLIDDYHKNDWPAGVKGVNNRQQEGALHIRHIAKSGVTFREKEKQWAVAEYTLMTVIVATVDPARAKVLTRLVRKAAGHPAVQQVIVLWNTPKPMPDTIKNLTVLRPGSPGSTRALITVIQRPTKSLNNRFDPTLPIHTGAVVIIDDDVRVTQETFTCMLNAYKSNPSRVYSIGQTRLASRTEYMGNTFFEPTLIEGRENFVLPWMIFHRSLLKVYHDQAYQELRDAVDNQAGHCDDITFAAIVAKYTGKPFVKIDAPCDETVKMRTGLASQTNRTELRLECIRFILEKLDIEDLPLVEKKACASFA